MLVLLAFASSNDVARLRPERRGGLKEAGEGKLPAQDAGGGPVSEQLNGRGTVLPGGPWRRLPHDLLPLRQAIQWVGDRGRGTERRALCGDPRWARGSTDHDKDLRGIRGSASSRFSRVILFISNSTYSRCAGMSQRSRLPRGEACRANTDPRWGGNHHIVFRGVPLGSDCKTFNMPAQSTDRSRCPSSRCRAGFE